jgi:1,4-dihydroxy-2-naphthoate octaprenyltransferase
MTVPSVFFDFIITTGRIQILEVNVENYRENQGTPDSNKEKWWTEITGEEELTRLRSVSLFCCCILLYITVYSFCIPKNNAASGIIDIACRLLH